MGKKIRIYESEIKRATRRKLMEKILVEDYEMRDTYSKSKFKPTPREKDIEGIFGQYGEDVDSAVIRYMRKNPDHILRRMAKKYPEIYMRHVPVQPDYRDYPGPIDVSDQYDEEGYYIDEATIEMSSDDFDKIKDMVGDETKNHTIKITESTQKLFKRFLNKK